MDFAGIKSGGDGRAHKNSVQGYSEGITPARQRASDFSGNAVDIRLDGADTRSAL